MPIIEANNLVKTYNKGKVLALDNVSLQINSAEIFGLIGPDGAGKTTLFRILTSLIIADTGNAIVHDLDVVKQYRDLRKIIGYMPGRFSLYQDLTVEENLQFFATLFNTSIKKNYNLIEDIYVQLEPFKNRRAGKLSGGMKQKLALCCALIHKPKILFLDEPTTGVDPVSRKEFWEMLKRLQQQEITILVSTPYMDEALLCDKIALMQGGKILQTDSPSNIIASYPKKLFAVKSDDMFNLLSVLRNYDQVSSAFSFGDALHISGKETLSENDIEQYLTALKYTDVTIQEIEPGIEDCFMQYMHTSQHA
ncbi:MAG: ABC transporter ATP-binding protein [Bacteroidetes bacterium]|nr:ABC transporter ATP-binding protein [Bacteroidota bacterium]